MNEWRHCTEVVSDGCSPHAEHTFTGTHVTRITFQEYTDSRHGGLHLPHELKYA